MVSQAILIWRRLLWSQPMLARLRSYGLSGIEAFPVEVEVDVTPGIPKTILVGLPEQAVKESVHRIERALANLGFQRPRGVVVINLAPADQRKEAGAFDLPIALGILVATRQLQAIAALGIAGSTPLEHALGDGEDYELLMAVSPADGQKLLSSQPLQSTSITKVGECVAEGFWLLENNKRNLLQNQGWQHNWA